MVQHNFVGSSKIIEGAATTVKCVHGDNVLYRLADIVVDVEGLGLAVRAAISDSLPMLVLLETDVPEIGQMFHCNPASIHTEGTAHALVTTRFAARQKESKIQFETGTGALPLEEKREVVEVTEEGKLREPQGSPAKMMVQGKWRCGNGGCFG